MQTSVNRRYGLDRGAVASAQAFAHSPATSRRSRSALARCASCAERNSLDFTHRRSLARSSGPLSALSNLPSPLSTVAARWHADSAVARPRRRSTGARQTRSVRDLHRRQLQFGEKRGAAVGPTRRGKGSKTWRSQTAMVFLSPAASPALRRMKRSSSKPPSSNFSREPNHSA